MTVKGNLENGQKPNDNQPASSASLDEAMLLTGFGIYNACHVLMSGVILAGVIMQALALGYVMPVAQCDLQLTLKQKGWLAAIPFIAIILTSHFWGWQADTKGRKPVMLVSMTISLIFSVLASFSPNLTVFAVLEFLSSIFMSGSSAVVYTYLGEFHSLRHRDKMVAFGSSFVGIGTVILPAISWVILPREFSYYIPFLDIAYRPWRLLVVACALPFAFGTIFLFFADESPKFLIANGQTEECLEVVKRIYVVNTRKSRDTFPVKSLIEEAQAVTSSSEKGVAAVLASMRDQTLPLFKSPLLFWTFLTCFVQFGIFATTNGFYVWFPFILNSLATHSGQETRICDILDAKMPNGTSNHCDDTMNTDTFELSIYIGLVFCSMYIIVGFLVDAVGKRLILVVVLGGAGLCGIGSHVANNTQVAVVLYAIFQMSGACIGLMNAVAVELFPTRLRAMAICLSMMMGRAGSVLGSNLIGFFLDVNCGAGFYLFGGILIVCALFCLTLPGKTQKVKQITVEPTQNETHEPV